MMFFFNWKTPKGGSLKLFAVVAFNCTINFISVKYSSPSLFTVDLYPALKPHN